jgi:hypothetical protein
LVPHSNLIEDLNVRTKTKKSLEGTKEVNLYNFGLGSGFLDMIPKSIKPKAKIDWNSLKVKAFVL